MINRLETILRHRAAYPGGIGRQPSRSVARPESTGRNTSAAQRNQPKTLRTQEPWGSWGQKSSDFCLRPELILGHRATYTNIAMRSRSPRSAYTHAYTERTGLPGILIHRLAGRKKTTVGDSKTS